MAIINPWTGKPLTGQALKQAEAKATKSGSGSSSSAGSTSLYDKSKIQADTAAYQKELKITPSQALNMALYGNSSGAGASGGTRYDPTLKKNVTVTGQQIRNMTAAEKALRGLGYTVQDARALSYNYKDANPISALNQNKALRTSPTVQTPTYTYNKSSSVPTNQYVTTGQIPTGEPTYDVKTRLASYETPTETFTPTESAPEGSANVFTAIPSWQKPEYRVGSGSTVVGEEEEKPQFRGSFNYL